MIAFTPEAIAACEQRGHLWARQEPWEGSGIGFDECARCGATGPVGRPAAPQDEPLVEVVELPATPPPRLRPGLQLDGESETRDAEMLALRSAGVAVTEIARRFGMSPTRVYQLLGRAKRRAKGGV